MQKIEQKDSLKDGFLSKSSYLSLAIISLVCLIITFLISNLEINFLLKAILFLLILAVCSVAFLWFYFSRDRDFSEKEVIKDGEAREEIFDKETEEKLLILEEADKFFGLSLKPLDTFRLVASRVNDLVPHGFCILFLVDEEGNLEASFTTEKRTGLMDISVKPNEGLIGKALFSEKVEIGKGAILDKKALPNPLLAGIKSAVAIPLMSDGEVFGVLNLYSEKERNFVKNVDLLEAIGERIAPLLKKSLNFEQTVSNAMTDSLTNLPNERGFYLVLEHQIAEAQRFQSERPLTVLAIDISGFDEFNGRFGHLMGDKLLKFTSEILKDQLREMDLVGRFKNDEFYAILPTASGEMMEKIIARLERIFLEKSFLLPDKEQYFVELNLGSATFLKDGETAGQLLKIASVKKKQNKSDEENTVIFFPKEYIN